MLTRILVCIVGITWTVNAHANMVDAGFQVRSGIFATYLIYDFGDGQQTAGAADGAILTTGNLHTSMQWDDTGNVIGVRLNEMSATFGPLEHLLYFVDNNWQFSSVITRFPGLHVTLGEPAFLIPSGTSSAWSFDSGVTLDATFENGIYDGQSGIFGTRNFPLIPGTVPLDATSANISVYDVGDGQTGIRMTFHFSNREIPLGRGLSFDNYSGRVTFETTIETAAIPECNGSLLTLGGLLLALAFTSCRRNRAYLFTVGK